VPSREARLGRVALALLLAAAPVGAQRADSARAGVAGQQPARRTVATADTVKPPISPRRAFLYSLLAPGYAQTILERPLAGAIFVGLEITSVAMAAKAANDLRYAKAHAADSIPLSYVLDPETGQPVLDPVTMEPKVAEYARNRYAGNRLKARRTHYEDWIALLIANHLFAGAEAFVSAQLWDLATHVQLRVLPHAATVGAEVRW
jgi:hypothetical protein